MLLFRRFQFAQRPSMIPRSLVRCCGAAFPSRYTHDTKVGPFAPGHSFSPSSGTLSTHQIRSCTGNGTYANRTQYGYNVHAYILAPLG